MLIETLIRILLIVIIAIIINIVIGKIPNDSNTRSLIRRWGRIITGVITVITILTFIFPWISSPFYNDDSKESFNESSYSEIVTTTSSTSNRITTPSTTKTTTTTIDNPTKPCRFWIDWNIKTSILQHFDYAALWIVARFNWGSNSLLWKLFSVRQFS